MAILWAGIEGLFGAAHGLGVVGFRFFSGNGLRFFRRGCLHRAHRGLSGGGQADR